MMMIYYITWLKNGQWNEENTCSVKDRVQTVTKIYYIIISNAFYIFKPDVSADLVMQGYLKH